MKKTFNIMVPHKSSAPARLWVAGVIGLAWLGGAWISVQAETVAGPETDRQVALMQRVLTTGFNALAEERIERATRIFEEAVNRWPAQWDARFGLATAYIKAHRYAEAVDLFERLLDEEPDDFAVLNNLAWLHATANDAVYRNGDRAVDFAQRALMLEPDNYHIWSTLSEAHFVKGNFERSARAAQQALLLAARRNARQLLVQDFREQLTRARRAAQAFAILD